MSVDGSALGDGSAMVLGLLFRVFVVWQAVWGLVAFVRVGRDKQLAQGGGRRIPERELHRLEAWGGWMGSFAAQRLFRHKTRKLAYQRVFRRVVLVWVLVWIVVLSLRWYFI